MGGPLHAPVEECRQVLLQQQQGGEARRKLLLGQQLGEEEQLRQPCEHLGVLEARNHAVRMGHVPRGWQAEGEKAVQRKRLEEKQAPVYFLHMQKKCARFNFSGKAHGNICIHHERKMCVYTLTVRCRCSMRE